MKNEKVIDEVFNPINMNALALFKVFSLPFWLVIMSISLSFVTQSVRAGTENIQRYYRYIPYQGPTNTTGTGAQQPKASAGASDTEAKKTNTEEQAKSTGGKTETAGPITGTPSEQVKKSDESTETKESTAAGAEKTTSGVQKPSPVTKPEKDTGEFPSGKLPSFSQVDINGDHYVTKDELQNFPELLQVFDKVDAGKDGRLEQHEYQNLEMETIREGEVL